MGLPRVQTLLWPLVYVALSPDTEIDEYSEHFRKIRGVLERNIGDYVVVIDARRLDARNFGSESRRAATAGLAEVQPFFARLRAQAFVVGDRLTRGLINSYLWITPRPYPTRVTTDLAGAVDWLQGYVPLTPEIKRSLAREAGSGSN